MLGVGEVDLKDILFLSVLIGCFENCFVYPHLTQYIQSKILDNAKQFEMFIFYLYVSIL